MDLFPTETETPVFKFFQGLDELASSEHEKLGRRLVRVSGLLALKGFVLCFICFECCF